MSIIYDNKDLMILLAGAGAADLMKQGQVKPPAAGPVDLIPYRMVKPFLVQLQRTIDPANAPPKAAPIGTKLDPATANLNADVGNLRTLGDFIQWAAEKKLTWGGKRFAWNSAEEAEARDAGAWKFDSYPKDRSDRNVVTRAANPVTAYALKPELVEYLTYLRDGPAKDPKNKVLQVMLSKIIGEVNVYLRAYGEDGIDAKAKPGATKSDLDPNMVV